MSDWIPGYSSERMRALWIGFAQNTLGKTEFKCTFGGKKRNVYRDNIHLLVLDEYHGHFEVLEMQEHAGKAKHLGIQEIDASVGTGQPRLRLGRFTPGGTHEFVLFGSL